MFNKLISLLLPHMPKKLVWIFSKRYVAGETIEDGYKISVSLNDKKVHVTIDLLGEFIQTLEQARENTTKYIEIVEYFTSRNVKGNFSVKPTMFGLLIDENACYRFVREIVAKAAEKKSFIRIDMEDSQCVDSELALYNKLREEFPFSVGIVIQAYLRRTIGDIEKLAAVNSPEHPVNFRLCKGIYIEPEQIAFKEKEEIRQNYLKALELMFRNNIYVGIATHDKYLIDEAYELIEKYHVPENRFEFQMLYGVTPELRQSIIGKGHLMRVYVPYGKDWFGYCTRRLKENPKIVSDIIKALFIRG